MDDIQFFGASSIDDQEDLPWGKEWVKRTTEPKRILEVLTIYSGDKGLLLITGEFKQFLFKRQLVTKQLLQALEVWVLEDNPVPPLITCFVNNKPQYGINKSGKVVYWHRDESKFYSTRVEEPLGREELAVLTNPFLTQTVPHDEKQKKPRSSKPKPTPVPPISGSQEAQEPA